MLYFNNTHPLDTFIETYEGEWRAGKKWGKGRLTWSNGDRYEGDFIDGKRGVNSSMVKKMELE
eukprot:TRINITY_DN979_c0_g1_i2.p2 TRINITY_DN979_c0_g1~~TRINITY_DN979_c0_g1_i2.p2  ORF type:complete len:63 (+),score=15.03 TRINITY_DN979_c0_g1_i2:255-443(+)